MSMNDQKHGTKNASLILQSRMLLTGYQNPIQFLRNLLDSIKAYSSIEMMKTMNDIQELH